jgi:hypothetical protein
MNTKALTSAAVAGLLRPMLVGQAMLRLLQRRRGFE